MLGLFSVFRAVDIFLQVIQYAILIYCVLSWFQPRFQAFYLLRQFITPFVMPFQRLSMKVRQYFNVPVDFTCLFAVLGLQLAQRLWWMLYRFIDMRGF